MDVGQFPAAPLVGDVLAFGHGWVMQAVKSRMFVFPFGQSLQVD